MNAKSLEKAAEKNWHLSQVKKPLITKAKKSIMAASVKIVAIGAKVTLRGERMYEFLEQSGFSFTSTCMNFHQQNHLMDAETYFTV